MHQCGQRGELFGPRDRVRALDQALAGVAEHAAWGVGGYCFFNDNPGVVADRVFEVPQGDGISFTGLVSVSLGGVGTIRTVINDTGDQVDESTFESYVVSFP